MRFDKNSYEPPILSANAYDATMLSVSALKNCEHDTACTKRRVVEIRSSAGVSGRFSISEGRAGRELMLKEVTAGKFMRAGS